VRGATTALASVRPTEANATAEAIAVAVALENIVQSTVLWNTTDAPDPIPAMLCPTKLTQRRR